MIRKALMACLLVCAGCSSTMPADSRAATPPVSAEEATVLKQAEGVWYFQNKGPKGELACFVFTSTGNVNSQIRDRQGKVLETTELGPIIFRDEGGMGLGGPTGGAVAFVQGDTLQIGGPGLPVTLLRTPPK